MTTCPPGSAFGDPVIAAYSSCGGCTGTFGQLITCNDDYCGLQSLISFPVVAGDLYYLAVKPYTPGSCCVGFVISVSCTPSNDDCAGALPVSLGSNGPYANASATDGSVVASCGNGGSPGYADLWYQWTAPWTGIVRIDTCGSPLDTLVSVYDTCGGPEIACGDDDCGAQSSVVASVGSGTILRIRVASSLPMQPGSFSLNVSPVVFTYGTSTPGCLGPVGAGVVSLPSVGNTAFAITSSNAPSNAPGILGLAPVPPVAVPIVVAGASIWIDLFAPTLFLVPAVSGASGTAQVPMPVPASPNLIGKQASTQFVWADSCASGGIAASDAIAFTIQG